MESGKWFMDRRKRKNVANGSRTEGVVIRKKRILRRNTDHDFGNLQNLRIFSVCGHFAGV